jgi:hypothetical protein
MQFFTSNNKEGFILVLQDAYSTQYIQSTVVTIATTIRDIIHRPAFYLKHNVWETGFCLRLQVEPTQLGPNR